MPSSTALFAIAAAATIGASAACARAETPAAGDLSDVDVKVAFIGDQGLGRGPRAVLELIKAEGATVVLHQGDLDYKDDARAFDRQVSDVLGADFPYFVSIGNHDRRRWSRYLTRLKARLERTAGASCSGSLGIMSACTYRGIFFVLSAVGLDRKCRGVNHRCMGSRSEHVQYIKEALAGTDAAWRVCSWHMNQTALQVGGKSNRTDWGVYEACRAGGAIIATAHNHAYARTHLIRRFAETPEIASTDSVLEIEKGKTIAFVSGLGGRRVSRPQRLDGDWWAAIYSATQRAAPGALFCTFNAGGQRGRAECYFKAINGDVPDRFVLISRLGK